jgi:hypothetical protein
MATYHADDERVDRFLYKILTEPDHFIVLVGSGNEWRELPTDDPQYRMSAEWARREADAAARRLGMKP